MGADLCSILGDPRRLEVSAGGTQWGPGVLLLENFGNFISKTVHFGEYLCHNNWFAGWVHFAMLRCI